jgi:hypothetical protein
MDCRSASLTKSPIPFAFFPNYAVCFVSENPTSRAIEPGASNIGHEEQTRVIRGSCKYCGDLIYMKYHASADETDLNMALCEDQSVVHRLQGATIHIFCKEEVPQGQKAWSQFSREQKQNLDKWEEGGKKRRTDV